MAVAFKYRAFISYSHRDRAWGEWLHKALEHYHVPKQLVGMPGRDGPIPRRIFPVFRDRDETPASADLQTAIRNALVQSANLIVICSPNSAASRWVAEEILAFKRLGREDRIFAFIVAGEPKDAATCFPLPLLFKLGPGGELSKEGLEPAAADARQEGDGRDNAKLKLIAGLLGADFDALKQRDLEYARRRTRLYRAVAAAMGILAVLALAGGGFAWHYALQSQEMTRQAVVQARTAERTTDFMVSLFSIADPEQNHGNTVTAREMLDRGVMQVESGLKDEPAVRGNLLRAMGQAYGGLGLYPKGRSVLLAAVAAARHSGKPDDSVKADLALASNLYMDGDNAAAYRLYQSTLSEAERLHSADHPSVAEALNGLGNSAAGLERDKEAEQYLRRGLAIELKLRGEKSAQTATALNDLATLLYAKQRFAKAEPLFRRALAIRLAVLGPRDANVAISLNNLGAIEYQTGRYADAERYYLEALPVYRAVYGNDHPEVAVLLNNIGRLQLMRNELATAQSTLTEALAMDRRFLTASNAALVPPLNSLGMLALLHGDLHQAETYLKEALSIAQAQKSALLDQVLGNCAVLYARQGREADAAAALLQARSIQAATYGKALQGSDAWRSAVLDIAESEMGKRSDREAALRRALPVLEARFGKAGFYPLRVRALLAQRLRARN